MPSRTLHRFLGICLCAAPLLAAAESKSFAQSAPPATGEGEGHAQIAHPMPPPAPNDSGEEERKPFALQVLGIDAAAVGLTFGGARADSRTAISAGLIGYFAGSPILHAVHGSGNGWWSLGAHLTLPIAGAVMGVRADEGYGMYTGKARTYLLGGMALATVLDATLLASKPVARHGHEKRASGFQVAPQVDERGRVGLMAVGTFLAPAVRPRPVLRRRAAQVNYPTSCERHRRRRRRPPRAVSATGPPQRRLQWPAWRARRFSLFDRSAEGDSRLGQPPQ